MQPVSTENYYDILGCTPANSKEQIATEYRKKSLLVHPDKSSTFLKQL